MFLLGHEEIATIVYIGVISCSCFSGTVTIFRGGEEENTLAHLVHVAVARDDAVEAGEGHLADQRALVLADSRHRHLHIIT